MGYEEWRECLKIEDPDTFISIKKYSFGIPYFETFPYRGPVPCQDLKRQVEAQRPVAAPLRGNDVTVPAPDDLHEPWLWFGDVIPG